MHVEALHLHLRLADRRNRAGLRIDDHQAAALLVDEALAVEPEGNLLEHLVIALVLLMLKRGAALLLVHGKEVADAQVVLREHGEASVIHRQHGAHVQRQAQRLAGLAAVKAQALIDGQRLARGDTVAVGLLPDCGEPDLPRAFEEEAVAVARAGHPAHSAAFVHQVEVGIVAVALFVRLAGDKRRAAPVRRPRQRGKKGIAGKIVQLKSGFFHGDPPILVVQLPS